MRIAIGKELNYEGMEYFLKIYFGSWRVELHNPFTSAFRAVQFGTHAVVTRLWFIDIIYFGRIDNEKTT